MDKYGYIIDISKNINNKLEFGGVAYQRITQRLSIIDSFKGNWKAIENSESSGESPHDFLGNKSHGFSGSSC